MPEDNSLTLYFLTVIICSLQNTTVKSAACNFSLWHSAQLVSIWVAQHHGRCGKEEEVWWKCLTERKKHLKCLDSNTSI